MMAIALEPKGYCASNYTLANMKRNSNVPAAVQQCKLSLVLLIGDLHKYGQHTDSVNES